MMHTLPFSPRQQGATLIEVLVTVLLLAFGLLGIAIFQSKAQVGTLESYQRAQALVLLEDMRARMLTNGLNAKAYERAEAYGVDDPAADCTTVAAGVARDTCEWGQALRGAGEKAGTVNVGAMAGARGCIETIQERVDAFPVCQMGVYRITIAWQGNHETKAPDVACGKDQYGSEKLRRAVSARVSIGTPNC